MYLENPAESLQPRFSRFYMCMECCKKGNCEKKKRIWSSIINRGLVWCTPCSIKNLMLEGPNFHGSSDMNLWELIAFSICWSIWMERNDLICDILISRIMWWIQASKKK